MNSSASPRTESTPTPESREPSRPRHFHFRRRRVLWALGLDTAAAIVEDAPQAVAH